LNNNDTPNFKTRNKTINAIIKEKIDPVNTIQILVRSRINNIENVAKMIKKSPESL
jgi:hypothetical protein